MRKIFIFIICFVLCLGLASAALAEEGDGINYTITVTPPENGSVSAEGMIAYSIEVPKGESRLFTIIPDAGYRVFSVLVIEGDFTDDWSWNLNYKGDGSFDFLLEDIQGDLTLEAIFAEEDLDGLLSQNFVVLLEDADTPAKIQEILANDFGASGYAVNTEDISVFNIQTDNIGEDGYGTFDFTVTLGVGESEQKTGYIVAAQDDILFKLTDEEGNSQICVAINTSHPDYGMEIEVPAMHSGTMEIFGCGNLIAAPLDKKTRDSLIDGKVPLPFYRAQFHIFSFYSGMNLYGIYVIQEDALCVEVSAKTDENEQKTEAWNMGRYTDLTLGSDTSEVYFGNEEFVLSLPATDIGAAGSFEVETGDFGGYTVEDNLDGTYSVHFLSDYYDLITLDLLINGSIERELIIHRVGVNIEECIYEEGPPSFTVAHGTQAGTAIYFSDGNYYRVYGTYYIPDKGDEAPYGLYVVYTWQDGSKTTEIITEPCNDPAPMSAEFINGVFIYGENSANACDYLLYAGSDANNAPVRINVTVLKGNPELDDSFSGVFFGSGAGVNWERE